VNFGFKPISSGYGPARVVTNDPQNKPWNETNKNTNRAKEIFMCTGVHSSVVFDNAPNAQSLSDFEQASGSGRTVTVTELGDGRVHVSCFSPVESTHADLAGALRVSSDQLKLELAGLRDR
jgi:hypothetical protein